MKKPLTAVALAVLTCTALTGPAAALNSTRSGGGHCTRWVHYTDAKGWPQYRCTSHVYR